MVKILMMHGSFEFEKATIISKYSFLDPCTFYSRSYYAPFWCDLCNSSYHTTNSCPYLDVMRNLTLYHPRIILLLS